MLTFPHQPDPHHPPITPPCSPSGRSTQDCRKVPATDVVVFHQSDVGEYLREEDSNFTGVAATGESAADNELIRGGCWATDQTYIECIHARCRRTTTTSVFTMSIASSRAGMYDRLALIRSEHCFVACWTVVAESLDSFEPCVFCVLVASPVASGVATSDVGTIAMPGYDTGSDGTLCFLWLVAPMDARVVGAQPRALMCERWKRGCTRVARPAHTHSRACCYAGKMKRKKKPQQEGARPGARADAVAVKGKEAGGDRKRAKKA